MRSNGNYTIPNLSTLTAAIAHSKIVVTAAVQRFLPVGFDDPDVVAILEWIAAEARPAKRDPIFN